MPYLGVERDYEQVHYVNNQNYNYRGNNLPHYYHLGLHNHDNLSYGNSSNVLDLPPSFESQASEKKPSIEDLLSTFIVEMRARFTKDEVWLNNLETHMSNMGTIMKSLEVQIGQLATSVNSQQMRQFPSDTEFNPREQCNAVILKSKKEIEEPKLQASKLSSQHQFQEKEALKEKKEIEFDSLKEATKPNSISFPDNPLILTPPLSHPQRFQKKTLDEWFAKFLDVFKKLHMSIHFAEALAQIPSYGKFMKWVLSNKMRLKENETIPFTEVCSVILHKKLLPKLKDLGSFHIPYNVGTYNCGRALCDLGASVNFMPLSVFRKLELGKPSL